MTVGTTISAGMIAAIALPMQELYTEMNIRKFDPALDRYRLANPHEDILDELDREIEKMQFAKACLQPVQEATKDLIENTTNRSMNQVEYMSP